ncbi:glucose-6-phosphate dehydrogenase [Pneumocystis carinii B80]|uniref:Glucose-6-phosphate 1-dehydrogenase n=1 Tax=Pneumocystis carinii (strain B80) TaxID=1408658 RepID=A0A0W4ZM38_PNEC8|nr:glucose-6-phosphate dehydrogenase [Pneumocystis carinii B80]KTW29424.1 glucose-6-phosphate dehydrogenase [Pneumocystis carinii B80]
MNNQEFHSKFSSYIKITSINKSVFNEFKNLCTYVNGKYDNDGFENLLFHCKEVEDESQKQCRIFYMALPPDIFNCTSYYIKKLLYPESGIARLVVEKPFGKDFESNKKLQKALACMWEENEIFRIDHYLGKEMVKNLLIIRFSNVFLDASWNKHYISNIQIIFKEPFGVEGRGRYFNEYGIIRDVIQNHLLQILVILTMERPNSLFSNDIRDRKVKILQDISAIEPKDVIIGQYTSSKDGSKPGYTDDETIPKDSRCPTFAALTLFIENERWKCVPFILIAGKALDEQKVEIRIQYKDVVGEMFENVLRNELVISLQPEEGIHININSKYPGLDMFTVSTKLNFIYKHEFPDVKIPEAYESLLLDAIKGDQSNFVRDDELDHSWRIFTPLLHYLDEHEEIKPILYSYGSEGPSELLDFIKNYGYKS